MQAANIHKLHDPYPLAIYNGKRPPAPDWFNAAINAPRKAQRIAVDGAQISYQQWGQTDKPGLLLSHGNGAHEHWFDFIAPAFSQEYNVVALSFSGMGASDWRNSYSLQQYCKEQLAVMRATGMFEHSIKPIIAAHSFGGIISLATVDRHAERVKGVITIDTPIKPPISTPIDPSHRPTNKTSFYTDLKLALSRFRLLPPQTCENHYILDYIARHSLKQTVQDGVAGWRWRFDPSVWQKIDFTEGDHWDLFPTISCKLACLRGEQSDLLTPAVRDNMLSRIHVPFKSIPNANHHVFLDNPLDTIAALEEILSMWGPHND